MAPGWFKQKGKKAAPPRSEKPQKSSKDGASSGSSQAAKAKVVVSKILSEELVLLKLGCQNKQQLLESLLQHLTSKKAIQNPKELLQKVLEREQGISTTLDTGLSLPHARVEGLGEICAALGVPAQPLQDPKQPDLSIRAMFLFFSPNASAVLNRHLQLLRSVSALFQPSLIDQLGAAAGPAEALELIRRQEAAG